jgi:long-chain acyl-CoA synthetase
MTDRSPFIDQMMLYNNQNKYTVALIVPNAEALSRWAKINNTDLHESSGLESVLKEIEAVADQYKQGGIYGDLFPSRWLPSAIAILDEPFTLDNKQTNSTGKMVRVKVVERHKDKIDFLYTPEAKNIVNPMNVEAIKKVLGIK